MSVYNRKMFKPRNARNALNMSAGIAPVQKFHAGGPVGHTHPLANNQQAFFTPPRSSVPSNMPAIAAARNASPTLNARMNVLQGRGTSPLRQTMNPGSGTINLDESSLSGIGSILSRSPQPEQSFRQFYGGGLKSMVTNPNPMTVGQQTRSDLAGMAATPVDAVVGGVASGMDAIGELLSPLTSQALTPGFVNAVITGKQALPDSVKQQINNREIPVPKALSDALLSGKVDPTGVDLAKLSGFQTSQEVADVVEIMNAAPGSQTVAVERPVPPETELGRDPGPVEDEAIAALAPPPGTGDLSQDRMFMGDADAPVKPVLPETELGRDPEPVERDAAATTDLSQKEIDRVINNGTQEEKQSTLDGFIKEFMDKAPGYEGADSGLILAKIGFAMAAGKSPRAIENIASAMSDGADMLIKDKAKKDEFNRQLKLSAMQYGFSETGKIRAEERLTARDNANVAEMVVGKGGTTYNGREYKEGESVFIAKGDLKAGTFPPNILGTAALTAIKNQATANATALKNALDRRAISPEQYDKQIAKYNKAVTSAIDAESGISLLEGAMITVTDGNVTGLKGAFQDTVRAGGAFLGMDLTKTYGDKTEVQNAMRAALQDVIPVTLGATQSANSISNRDVDFLITAYFGEGALNGGKLAFATQTESEMVQRLQRAVGKMRKAQKSAFSTMKTTEKFLSPLYQPGTTDSAIGILSEDQRRLRDAGLMAGGAKGSGVYVGGQQVISSLGATRGDDGIIRFDV
tara:strand:- start:5385 stop:7631 length:2247 start_codon:yes stop_codon:yes gene_type:complete